MPAPTAADRRRRIRTAVATCSAALLAGAWGTVALAGKRADTTKPATSATPASSSAAPSTTDSTDSGSSGATQAAPAVTSAQS